MSEVSEEGFRWPNYLSRTAAFLISFVFIFNFLSASTTYDLSDAESSSKHPLCADNYCTAKVLVEGVNEDDLPVVPLVSYNILAKLPAWRDERDMPFMPRTYLL